jgi:hypothetical protein
VEGTPYFCIINKSRNGDMMKLVGHGPDHNGIERIYH